MSEELNQRPKRLTARRKFQLYLETRNPDANIGEILRRYGVHLIASYNFCRNGLKKKRAECIS